MEIRYGVSNDGKFYRLDTKLELSKKYTENTCKDADSDWCDKGVYDGIYYEVGNAIGVNKEKVQCMDNCVLNQKENITDTSDWQTYISKQFVLFYMQYPKNWVKVENNKSGDSAEFKIINNKNDDHADLSIYILRNPSKKTLQQIFDDEYNVCEQNPTPMGCPGATDTSDWKKLTILTKPALLSDETGMPEGPAKNYYLYIDFDSFFLVFRGTDWSKIENFQDTFNKIIGTIKS